MFHQFLNTLSVNQEYVFRIIVATLLSAVIGIEREMHGRAAGARTNILVGTGSALFMVLSIIVASYGKVLTSHGVGVPDPARIAAQIVTGVGFLGAGTIIKHGSSIKGLTTAACMWIVASIGMAAGAGQYFIAVYVTLISLIVLVFFTIITRILPSHSYRKLFVKTSDEESLKAIIKLIKQKAKILSVDFEHNYVTHEHSMDMEIRIFHSGTTDKICHSIISGILDITEKPLAIKWNK